MLPSQLHPTSQRALVQVVSVHAHSPSENAHPRGMTGLRSMGVSQGLVTLNHVTPLHSAARELRRHPAGKPGSATLPVRIARRRGRQMICSSGATAFATGAAAHMAPRVSRRGAPKQPHGRRAARHPRSPINLPSPKGRPTVPTRPLTSPHIDHQRPRLRTRPPEDSMHSRTHPSRAFTARSCHHRR